MKTRLIALPSFLLCAAMSFAQLQLELSRELIRHTLVLRNFYTAQKLRFGQDGTLISGEGARGFGPIDGRVYVEAVQLDANRLMIRGERPVSLFDPATGETRLLGLRSKVEIEVDLPLDADEPQTRAALDRVFFTPAEADAFECSSEEASAFRDRMLRSKATVSVRKEKAGDDRAPQQLCFPGGSRAYIAESAVEPPKPLKTHDPAYPASMAGKPQDKTVVLALIVDPTGRPASFVVIAAAPTMFELAALDAVQHWRFLPASYHEKPVPAAINVEVNFKYP
ncbi:MAG: energy transducer TonB [Candidatus Korobacteraceae bacterium]